MFDDLDDPAFPGPRPGAREAVLARGARLRRNRQAAVTAGVASFVLVLAGAGVGLRSLRPDETRGVEPLTTGDPTAQESPTPTASPSPTASRTPTVSPAATTTPPRITTEPKPPTDPTTAPPARRPAVDHVDGWLGMMSIERCRPATALPPRPGGLEEAGVTMTLEIPAVVDATKPPVARLVFRNDNDQGIWFSFHGSGGGPVHTIAGGPGGFSGDTWREDVDRSNPDGHVMDLDPGETDSVEIPVLTDTCAGERVRDRRGEPTLLEPGTYDVAVGIMVTDTLYWGPPPEETPAPGGTQYRPPVYSTRPVSITVR